MTAGAVRPPVADGSDPAGDGPCPHARMGVCPRCEEMWDRRYAWSHPFRRPES